jgi:hypothetical protein
MRIASTGWSARGRATPFSVPGRVLFVGAERQFQLQATADRNRFASHAMVKQLFDRRTKGMEIRVENGGCDPSRCFLASPSAKTF